MEMTRAHLKLCLTRVEEDTISVMVFLGNEGQTLQNAGTIRMRVGEYQIFTAALGLGLKMPAVAEHALMTIEGEKEALR